MFSLDRFYNILHSNLVADFTNGRSVYFYPFGTYDNVTFLGQGFDTLHYNDPAKVWKDEPEFFHCYFFDQEPLYDYTVPIVRNAILNQTNTAKPRRVSILANSEHSQIKQQCCQDFGMYDWYYFYHGFAALDWYRDFQYVNSSSFNRFNKVFMCYNHLTAKYRSYRLHLVSNLIEQDLLPYGNVSLFAEDWRKSIEDPTLPLDNRARVKIYKALRNTELPIIADTVTPTGSLSANVNLDQLTDSLFHVVTETVYFQDKLHLTEKAFKPIVARRPFFLVSTPGSLAYLKRYGFKSFDRWIDESYDLEQDHYVRIEKITFELAKLCAMDPKLLEQMYLEMQETLNYNFNHFYTTFKDTIVDELVDNFTNLLDQVYVDRGERFTLTNPEEVKKLLKQ